MSNDINESIPTMTNQIYAWVEEKLGRSDSKHINRASSAGKCPRARWYQKEGYEGDTITPRAILNFAAGDIGETVMLNAIIDGAVGPGKMYSEIDFGEEGEPFIVQSKTFRTFKQEDLVADIGGFEITAHADGFAKLQDGLWRLIECKTASDYGFKRFQDQGPDDSYLMQAHALMMTHKAIELGIKQVHFIYMKKSTGHIWDRVIEWDADVAKKVINWFKESNGAEIPDRPYEPEAETFRKKPTGKHKLPWQCSYCSYSKECWPNASLEMKGGKPVYYVELDEEEKKKNAI